MTHLFYLDMSVTSFLKLAKMACSRGVEGYLVYLHAGWYVARRNKTEQTTLKSGWYFNFSDTFEHL